MEASRKMVIIIYDDHVYHSLGGASSASAPTFVNSIMKQNLNLLFVSSCHSKIKSDKTRLGNSNEFLKSAREEVRESI